MKRYFILILAVLFTTAVCSCSKRFEESYEHLVLNTTSYSLKADGGNFQFMVYYNNAWTAEINEGTLTEQTIENPKAPDWIFISRDGASHQDYLRVTYEPAIEQARTVYITIKADNGEQAIITLKQDERDN